MNILKDKTRIVNTMETVKAKRGRKPKVQTEEIKKPRTKTVFDSFAILNPAEVAASNDTPAEEENIILRLNITDEQTTANQDEEQVVPLGYTDPDTFESQPIDFINFTTQSTLGVESSSQKPKIVHLLKDFEQKNKQNEWPSNTQIACYWCCHQFNNSPFGIPVKYRDSKYHVYGCFCSLECAAAYNFASKENMDEIWEQYNLINQLSREIGHKAIIKPSPNRLALKLYGG
jgi:hypothetical protein